MPPILLGDPNICTDVAHPVCFLNTFVVQEMNAEKGDILLPSLSRVSPSTDTISSALKVGDHAACDSQVSDN